MSRSSTKFNLSCLNILKINYFPINIELSHYRKPYNFILLLSSFIWRHTNSLTASTLQNALYHPYDSKHPINLTYITAISALVTAFQVLISPNRIPSAQIKSLLNIWSRQRNIANIKREASTLHHCLPSKPKFCIIAAASLLQKIISTKINTGLTLNIPCLTSFKNFFCS